MHAAESVSFGSRVFADVGDDGSVLSGLNSLVVVAAAPTNPVETEPVSATMEGFVTFARGEEAEAMQEPQEPRCAGRLELGK